MPDCQSTSMPDCQSTSMPDCQSTSVCTCTIHNMCMYIYTYIEGNRKQELRIRVYVRLSRLHLCCPVEPSSYFALRVLCAVYLAPFFILRRLLGAVYFGPFTCAVAPHSHALLKIQGFVHPRASPCT
jgi:hypothetical protein